MEEAFTVGLLSNLFSKLLGSGDKRQSGEPTHARLEDVLDRKTLELVRDARKLRASIEDASAPARGAQLTELAVEIDAAWAATRVPFAVADLETTGLDAQSAEIIEFAAVLVEPDGSVASEFSMLVKPQNSIPAQITQITGITQADINALGQPLALVLAAFLKFIGDRPVFFHNAPFDTAFIGTATAKNKLKFKNSVHDTLPIARRAWPALGTYKLGVLAAHIGAAVPTHRALGDAHATLAVLLAARKRATSCMTTFGEPSAMMDLHFSDIDAEQLAQCRSGDRLNNLWLSPDQSFVNVYRRGTMGGQGRVATLYCKDNPGLLDVMTEGLPVWLILECRTDSGYVFELHMTTSEEVRTQQKEAGDQRRIELRTPYTPKKPIVVEMRAPEAVSFQEGQQLTFKGESIDHYAISPSANLEFIVAPPAPLAFLRAGPAQRTRILRAYFSGFTIHAQVTKVSPEPVNAGDASSIWKEASATVRITFTK
jgi:DNA polymerase-3 subunit epsilon